MVNALHFPSTSMDFTGKSQCACRNGARVNTARHSHEKCFTAVSCLCACFYRNRRSESRELKETRQACVATPERLAFGSDTVLPMRPQEPGDSSNQEYCDDGV